MRIMVVDDEPFVLKLHAHMLAELGYLSARTFSSGDLALADMTIYPAPELIVLDLSMPQMDGIEFIRHLVSRHYTGALVLVSGEDARLRESAERLVRAHGIVVLGHLAKPVQRHQLRGLLEAWTSRPADTAVRTGKAYSVEEVTRAFANREIVNFYQPKVSIQTGEIVGVETLARWLHPQDGVVGPDSFIEIAEQHGLIEPLTRQIFREALRETVALADHGMPLQVAINLAPSTLTSVTFADFLAATAAEAAMPPQNIVLELTESRVLGDLRGALDVLTRLRLKRFKLSIDDFGTGYSSLAQLRELPFDEMKIDRTFVHRASVDRTARAIFDASYGLAKQLDMTTVAEGVEDQADWDFIKTTNCDEAQGYFIARPMPAEDLPAWSHVWRDRRLSGHV